MANTEVKGKIVDAGGDPVPGLRVIAYDVEVIFDDVELGRDTTSASGDFRITYPANLYGLEANPDIRIRIFDPVKRLLYESPIHQDVSDPVLVLSVPPLNRADIEGWLVTGFDQTRVDGTIIGSGTPQYLSTGNTVKLLIDNSAAWRELTTAVQQTRGGSVRLLIHYLDVENVITLFSTPYDSDSGVAIESEYSGKEAKGIRLEEALLEVNRAHGAKVWLVINDFPLPWADTATPVELYLEYQNLQNPHTVKFKRFPVPQFAPMHAKVVVVEGVNGKQALIPASGLIQEYFDGNDHWIDDPRRGTMGFSNFIKVPVHDVSVSFEGPTVNHFDETIRLYWDHVSPSSPIPPLPAFPSPTPATATAVQVARTVPTNVFSTIPKGETGILEAYQRAFRNAADFIYIETQYFVEDAIADSLVAALEDALKRNVELQLIMLINISVDVPFYNKWQTRLVEELLAHLSRIGAGDRAGVFTLWTHAKTTIPPDVIRDRIIRNYVHSKIAIVDDEWATIGSANMEGTGLNRAQHISWLPEGLTSISRGTEVNAVFFNGVDNLPASQIPDKLRRTLWAEHLGYRVLTGPDTGNLDPNHPDLLNKPATGGWLQRWTDRAKAKIAALKLSPPVKHAARILPWRPETDPKEYLEALNISKINNEPRSDLTVETAVRNFDFKKGKWK
jgi:phosphatidylserine/phosphatidylglycerophosphate/cardiolipin synthase-like enzyme